MTDGQWHADEARLLDEIRQTRDHWAFLPDVPGCTGLLEIGRGGQGIVYRARRATTKQVVAIKVLLDGALASSERRVRFEREIEIAASLRHENIVRVYESGTTSGGHLYFVMDHVDGVPLVDETNDGRRRPTEALQLLSMICGAVLHAHQRGIVHRDLKGTNILIDDRGEPRLLDFGLAAVMAPGRASPDGPTSISLTGQILGSLPWASPEQLQGDPRAVDTRADIYALGVLLYRITTGVFPHDVTANLQDTLDRIVNAAPERPRALVPEIPEDVEAITLRCLASDPDDRYATVEELQRDIDDVLRGEPIEARRRLAWQRIRRTMQRYRSIGLAAVGAAVVLLAVSVTMVVLYRRAADAETIASTRLVEARTQAERARRVKAYIKDILIAANQGSSGRRESTVRGMLDRAAGRLPHQIADPLARAEIALTIGEAYVSLGADEAATGVLEDALAIYRAAAVDGRRDGGEVPPMIARAQCATLVALAKAHGRRGRLDEAETLLDEAGDVGRAHPQATREHRFWVAIDHANLLAQRGRVVEAERQLSRSIEDMRAASSWPAPLMQALHELGRFQSFLGKHEDAERNLREAYTGLTALMGPSSVVAARCATSLAHCLTLMEEMDEAQTLAEGALAVHLEHLGEDHQHVAEALEVLSVTRAAHGDAAGAEAALERALGIGRRIFGDEHTQVAHLLERWGTFMQSTGRYDDADLAFREALAIYQALLPQGHIDRVITRGKIGACHAAAGRYDDAAPILEEATASLARQLGPDHPLVVRFRTVRDAVDQRRGAPPRAESDP